jgi:Holliday junction resolvase RusA-like endonuclease
MILTFAVPIAPVPQPRPRVHNNHAFVPKEHKIHSFRNAVATCAAKAILETSRKSLWPVKGRVVLTMNFYLKRPRSQKKAAFPLSRPDVSNLLKGAEDALKGQVWVDDSQVTDLTACKRYVAPGQNSGVVITITTY